jgi:Uma2 family endonuclease
MSLSIARPLRPGLIYPESDGEPIAENTLQFEWIVTIKGNLEVLFLDRPDVFVAGDLLWYPVEGDPKTRTAPDTMLVFGRPKGYRGSYRQWEEGGIAPQVVFEVLSPGNRTSGMIQKLKFYEQFGVEEYYIYDPDGNELTGCRRIGNELVAIEEMNGWTSPRLGIRFDSSGTELRIFGPDGRAFLTFAELAQLAQERNQLAQERDQIAQERNQIAQKLEAAQERAERLAAQLRSLGVQPQT